MDKAIPYKEIDKTLTAIFSYTTYRNQIIFSQQFWPISTFNFMHRKV